MTDRQRPYRTVDGDGYVHPEDCECHTCETSDDPAQVKARADDAAWSRAESAWNEEADNA